MFGIFSFLCGVVFSCWLMQQVHFNFIEAQASSAGHTAFEVEHAVLKGPFQIQPFEAGISYVYARMHLGTRALTHTD